MTLCSREDLSPFMERLSGHVEVLPGQGDLYRTTAEVGLLQGVLRPTVDQQGAWGSREGQYSQVWRVEIESRM